MFFQHTWNLIKDNANSVARFFQAEQLDDIMKGLIETTFSNVRLKHVPMSADHSRL